MNVQRAHAILRLKRLGFKPQAATGGVLLSTTDANRIASILLRLGFAAKGLTVTGKDNGWL